MKIKQIGLFVAFFAAALFGMQATHTASAAAATKTYTANFGTSDAGLGNANNWSPTGVPANGDDLIFPDQNGTSINVPISANFTAHSMTFQTSPGANSQYTFVGDSNNFDQNISSAITVNSGQTVSIFNTNFTGDVLATVSQNATLSFAGMVYLAGHTLTVQSTNYSQLTTDSAVTALTAKTSFSGGANSSVTGTGEIVLNGVDVEGIDIQNPYNYTLNKSMLIANASNFTRMAGNLVLNNSQLRYRGSADTTVSHAMTINGNLFGTDTSNYADGTVSAIVNAGTGSATSRLTLSGALTLPKDILVGNVTGTNIVGGPVTLSGALTGGKYISPAATATLTISSSSNSSAMPNGTYTGASSSTISGNSGGTNFAIHDTETLTVDGTAGLVFVMNGGTLKGHGTVGTLKVSTGGSVAPGNSPGCLAAGDTTFATGSSYNVEIGGTTVCSQYDQLGVTGTVTINNATLNISPYNNFVPTSGQSFTVINNDSNDAVTGTFNGLAEGATFTANGVTYKITYAGGDGNDVVLTVASVDQAAAAAAAAKAPGTPNTGLALVAAHPLVSLLATTAAAVALYVTSRRFKPVVTRR